MPNFAPSTLIKAGPEKPNSKESKEMTIKILMKVIFENFDKKDEDKRQMAKLAHDKLYFYLVKAKFTLLEIRESVAHDIQGIPLLEKNKATFLKWFISLDNVNIVLNNISDIHRRFEDEDIILTKASDPNAIAFVNADSEKLRINLCEQFWELEENDERYDRALGTILHELSHLVCNTADHCYGVNDCQQLSAALSVENADSYEYYIEDLRRMK